MILNCDPRVHFVLNCGAVSCAPIGVYSSDSLSEQLNIATAGFIASSSSYENSSHTLSLSKIFDWYWDDFQEKLPPDAPNHSIASWIDRLNVPTESDRGIVSWVCAYCEEIAQGIRSNLSISKALKIRYESYDWDLNGA